MKIVGQLKAILGLDKTKFDQGIDGAEKKTNKFAGAMKKLGGVMAALFAVAGLARFARAATDAYKVQLEAEVKLATVLKQRMGLGKATVKNLADQASEYQKIGVIGDEVQLSGLQQLATFLRQKESLESLLPAMNNLLAQQKGTNATAQDAVGIANMMGKVLDGQVSSLRRIGISFSEAQGEAMKTGNEMERASMLAQVITDNVGNMNEELGKTDLGKITRWHNAWGDFKELLGARLMPILGRIADWGTKMLPKIIAAFGGMRKAVVAVINYFIDLYNESTAFRLIVQSIIFVLRTMWDSFKTGIKTTVGYFQILGQVLKDVFTGNWKAIGDHVRQGLQGIAETVEDYGQSVAENWDKMMENMTKKPHVQLIEIKPVAPGETESGITAGGGGPAARKGESLISTTAGAAALPQVAPALESLALLQMGIEKTKQQLVDMEKVTDQVFSGLADSFYDAFTGTGNMLEDFGKAFGAFIKDLIARMAAATLAALALAMVMSMIPGLGAAAGIEKGASFGKIFGGLLTKGLGIGMAKGGTIPPGFPNDSFGPVMLSSGETVLTAQQSRNLSRGIDITVHGEITGRNIALAGRRTELEN